MSTIDIVYGIGIAAFIIIAIVAFTIALSREKGDQEGEIKKDEQTETDGDFRDCERPFVSLNDQFN